MLLYLPAVFFLILTIRSIRKYGWNIQALLYALFAITGIASILIDINGLYVRTCVKMPLGFFAPLTYCIFLYVTIHPFGHLFRGDRITYINKIKNEKFIDRIEFFFFAVFLLVLCVAFTRLDEILFHSVLNEVRQDRYMYGTTSFYDHLSGIPRYICAISTFFFAASYINLLFFFYDITCRSKSLVSNCMTLLGSTSPLLSSVMQADRSQFLYYIFLFTFCFTLFYRNMDKQRIRKLFAMIVPLILGVIVYFISVSISRWGQDEEAGGSVIIYVGQNFINYCNFTNNLWDTPRSLCELFPFTTAITGGKGYFEFAELVEKASHIPIAVFSTFLGLIFSISGPVGLLLFLFFYWTVSRKMLIRKKKEFISLSDYINLWIVALVPLLGVFGYFYMEMNATLAILFWLYFAKKSH